VNFTSLKISDLVDIIQNMAPVKIYLNNEIVFDDDSIDINDLNTSHRELEKYTNLLKSEKLVISIKFDIVHLHHSICHITTI
jgi:hypothetical protein